MKGIGATTEAGSLERSDLVERLDLRVAQPERWGLTPYAIDPSLLAAYAKDSEQELGVGDSVAIEMNYARVMMSDWQRLETSVRDLLSRCRAQP